jgi:hypothetical protein
LTNSIPLKQIALLMGSDMAKFLMILTALFYVSTSHASTFRCDVMQDGDIAFSDDRTVSSGESKEMVVVALKSSTAGKTVTVSVIFDLAQTGREIKIVSLSPDESDRYVQTVLTSAAANEKLSYSFSALNHPPYLYSDDSGQYSITCYPLN